MWKINSEFEETSICGRFILFRLFLGGAQLIDKGTETIERKVRNFNSVKGAKIAAKKWLKNR